MKMEQQPGNVVTQFFAWLAAIAAALGWTTQDLVYFIFGAIGVVISIASYINSRMDARAAKLEARRRTKIIEDYIHDVQQKPVNERPSAVEVISEAVAKSEA
ncbi:hypothetical protein [Erwinia sp. Leaf53]|uniref:hypothetical protein n=1 Tax=Erwinia sp. Leaf53 TaxID=1736225 RepID=UPI0006F6A662|nr:hypothetical protein [Erwinia sp. Leaf53]KQN63645.1 hypothetical protein ASF13_18895 [Erwinia sp. Leaf53]